MNLKSLETLYSVALVIKPSQIHSFEWADWLECEMSVSVL